MWLWIPVILLMVFLMISFVTYMITFYSPHKGQNDVNRLPPGEQYEARAAEMHALIDNFAVRPFQPVYTLSRDGLRLFARYYHTRDGAPLAICCHGYRATGPRDFSGGSAFLIEQGCNVLLIDERAEGESEGHTITFGIKERYDVLSWIDYINARFGSDTKILLFGVSMGAATVLYAAGEKLPRNVVGILADSPYSSPETIIRKVCRDLRAPDAILYPFIAAGAFLFGFFRLSDADAVRAVRNARVPILILHGEDDRFVPCDMSAPIAAANPDYIKRYTFPRAAHGISYLEDPVRYRKIAADFIADAIR